jgi:adenosine deaminase
MKIRDIQPELRNLVPDLERLKEIMTFQPGDTKYNFQRFLQKFQVLNHIKWNEDSIDIACEQVVGDLAAEGIGYSEIRYSIDKYLNHINWDETEANLFFLNRLIHWANEYKVKVGPVLCMKHETPTS